MNTYVERVNSAVRTEYLDRFYEENGVSKINEILYNYLIKYSFYRPHRSLNFLNPIEYYNKSNNKDSSMVQIYLTQTGESYPTQDEPERKSHAANILSNNLSLSNCTFLVLLDI